MEPHEKILIHSLTTGRTICIAIVWRYQAKDYEPYDIVHCNAKSHHRLRRTKRNKTLLWTNSVLWDSWGQNRVSFRLPQIVIQLCCWAIRKSWWVNRAIIEIVLESHTGSRVISLMCASAKIGARLAMVKMGGKTSRLKLKLTVITLFPTCQTKL